MPKARFIRALRSGVIAQQQKGMEAVTARLQEQDSKIQKVSDRRGHREDDEIFLSCGTKGLLLFLSAYCSCDPFDAATYVGCRSPR